MPILRSAIDDSQRILPESSPTIEYLLGNLAVLEGGESKEKYERPMRILYGDEGGRWRTKLRYGNDIVEDSTKI